MKQDDKALRPEIFNIPGYIQEKKTDVEVLTEEEKILAAGSENQFWKILSSYFDNEIKALDEINETAISKGMPLEEIGRNALVISMVRGVLTKIKNRVKDAKEALDERGGEK